MSTKSTSQLLNILNKFNIKEASNIYVGVDIIMIAKILNCKSNNLSKLADSILQLLLNVVGKSGTVVIPVFNLDCVPEKKFDRKNSPGQSGMFGNLLLKKYYKFRTRHPMYSFLVFGKKSEKYMRINNQNATGNNSLWKNFNDDNFQLITLGHHYVRSLTHVHYLENLVNVNYRFIKIFQVNYTDFNRKKFTANYSFFARKLDLCEFSSITKNCDRMFFKKNIAKFKYQNGLICFKLNLKKASSLILKSFNKNSKNLVSYIKIGKEHINKNILSPEDRSTFNLEKKYLLKKKMIYKFD
jgi:aminoglycoside 3-N-acetyltransferase